MPSTTVGRRPSRRMFALALLLLLPGSTVALATAFAPAAEAATTVLVPPDLDWRPTLTGGPARKACGATVRCVGPTGSFATIQAAVNVAVDGDTIQVQGGTYAERVVVDSKELVLLGGFAPGFGSRDPATRVTTINGGLAGTTLTWIRPGDSVIDGFRITGGEAPLDEFGRGYGSGLYVDHQDSTGDVTITHNLFEGNDDGQDFNDCDRCVFGGAIAVGSWGGDSSATIADNIIRDNRAVMAAALFASVPVLLEHNLIEDNAAGGDHGGALFLSGDDSVLRQNLVRGNTVGDQAGYGWGGGGIFTGNDTATKPTVLLEANRWVGNESPSHGSAFFVDEAAHAEIVGDLFHGNVCNNDGVLYLDGGSDFGSTALVENVTISANGCPDGANGAGILAEGGSRLDLRNSIVTGNGGATQVWQCNNCQTTPPASNTTITYSLVGPSTGAVTRGVGVITGAPGFVAPAGGDFHLMSSSPAIDAADPASTVAAEPVPNGGRRNAGAYGGTDEATTSDDEPPVPIAPESVTTSIGRVPKPSRTGRATVVVEVADGLPAATGDVRVRLIKRDGTRRQVVGTLDGGAVTVTLPRLSVGRWRAASRYLGDSAYLATSAPVVRFRVRASARMRVRADDPIPGLPPPAADVWDGSCDTPATGTTYDVGPGRAWTTIGAVPWLDLGPGDRVRIHARPAPYKEKILVVGQGTASEPITVCGVRDGEGNRPVIDGKSATTRPGMRSDFEGTQLRGVITLAAPDNTPWGTKPKYVVIDGLEVTGGYPGNTFTDWAGVTRTYPDNVAGIFVERGEWVTVRDTVIRGNANGLFVASGDEEASVSRHVLVDGNAFLGNSVVGRDREHHSYIEAEDVVYQFNHYGDTRAGALGGALKDRSTGTVVRFNTIEGGFRAMDLVEAQDSFPIFGDLPAYRETWVYGNVVDLTHGDAAYAIHYGGDSGLEDTYRKGTLYFFNNTVVYRFDQSEQYNASVFDITTPDETAEIWGNVFSAGPATPGATPLELSLERGSGVHHLGANVMGPAMVQWRSDTHTGSITGWSSRITASNLGFTDLAGSDFRPVDGSPLVDVGATAPRVVPSRHALAYQYVPHQLALGRPVNGTSVDAGAYENGPATPIDDLGPDLADPTFALTVPRLRYDRSASIEVVVTGDGAAASGQVSLHEGARTLDTATLDGDGSATFDVAPGELQPGAAALVVEYGGSPTVAAGQLDRVAIVGRGVVDRVSLTVLRPPLVDRRGRVSVTVDVAAGLATPEGAATVRLTRGDRVRTVEAALVDGTATMRLPRLSRGRWEVVVRFGGDDRYRASRVETFVRVRS
ncbi:hypothetical protein F0U44_08865 [Nocardioides humilatus]|uniref:Right handed beta helix domain-containing protein n=1 Tax=Nocardioides humilatus TaxID=2607660 RepID=A0A5B1LCX0_9ACTN|nr:hypothetical protein [Nocardioides humilatus]KAA1418601.1 hypothetical protein F0U44_08865 [Nocardioides humilatus]